MGAPRGADEGHAGCSSKESAGAGGDQAHARGRDHPACPPDRRRLLREAPAHPVCDEGRSQRQRRDGRCPALRRHRHPGRLPCGPLRHGETACTVSADAWKRNPIAAWLDGLGLFGLRSYEKFVPAQVFGLPNEQVALFLRHLWATDGCIWWDEKMHMARIYYGSTSKRLIEDVSRLLPPFGILTRSKRTKKAGYRDSWQLVIGAVENQLRLIDLIGCHGLRGEAAARWLPD